jgi:uncharacterized protein (UPF0276 family)
VWELYARACDRTGPRSTLLEWDENIPEFAVVHREVLKAKDYFAAAALSQRADSDRKQRGASASDHARREGGRVARAR